MKLFNSKISLLILVLLLCAPIATISAQDSTVGGNAKATTTLSTTPKTKKFQTVSTMDEVKRYIADHFSASKERLLIENNLNSNMAAINAAAKKKGYIYKSAVQKDGYRMYIYAKEEEKQEE